jgi:CheY-like chemotaxis protein
MAFSTQTALETEVEYQPNVVPLDIGLPQQSLEAGFEHHLAEPVDPQTLQELMAAPAKQLSTR